MRFLDQCDVAQGERGVEYIQVRAGDAGFITFQPRVQVSLGPRSDRRIQQDTMLPAGLPGSQQTPQSATALTAPLGTACVAPARHDCRPSHFEQASAQPHLFLHSRRERLASTSPPATLPIMMIRGEFGLSGPLR